jgi:hypothetical protein
MPHGTHFLSSSIVSNGYVPLAPANVDISFNDYSLGGPAGPFVDTHAIEWVFRRIGDMQCFQSWKAITFAETRGSTEYNVEFFEIGCIWKCTEIDFGMLKCETFERSIGCEMRLATASQRDESFGLIRTDVLRSSVPHRDKWT